MSIHVKTAAGWEEIGVSSGGDLVGGVAGWAAIESVTGTASLTDLKAAGIAPDTATADDDCEGTYNIVGDDGVVYRVAVWTGNGSIKSTEGLLDVFMVSAGGGSRTAYGAEGNGADIRRGLTSFDSNTHNVIVGKPVINSGDSGEPSSVGPEKTTGAGPGQPYGSWGADGKSGTHSDQYPGLESNVTGSSYSYAAAGRNANYGDGAPVSSTSPGKPGIVIVRAPKDAANNPKPDAPVAWGDFTTNGDEQDSGTWGPDAQGRTWKWAEWNVADDYSVNLTGGQYWVLTVGGGSNGWNSTGYLDSGQPGLVNEGYWEFNNGPTPIKVGAKGTTADTLGFPSSIGSYGTQGIVTWGNDFTGRGSTAYQDQKGYTSYIRDGQPATFATGSNGVDSPGRADKYGGSGGRPGCVIIATVTNDPNTWNPPGALPGIGGWATITGIDGTAGTRYQYGDWVAYEWTSSATGGVVFTDGLLDTFIVGAGSTWGVVNGGSGGDIVDGIRYFTGGTHDIVVGNPGTDGQSSGFAGLYTRIANPPYVDHGQGAGAFTGSGDRTVPRYSSITGTSQPYSAGRNGSTSPVGHPGGMGTAGTVIVRVPKAHAYLGALPAGWVDATVRSVAKEKAKEAVKSEIKSRRKKK